MLLTIATVIGTVVALLGAVGAGWAVLKSSASKATAEAHERAAQAWESEAKAEKARADRLESELRRLNERVTRLETENARLARIAQGEEAVKAINTALERIGEMHAATLAAIGGLSGPHAAE